MVGHAFEHFKNKSLCDAPLFSENMCVGQVKQIMRSQTKMHGCDIFRLKSEFQHTFEICIGFNFGLKNRQRPTENFRLNCFHYQIRAFYQTHFYRTSGVFDALFCPFDQLLLTQKRIWKISLQNYSGL